MSTVAWKMKDDALKAVKESEAKFKEQNEAAAQYKLIPYVKVVRKVPREVHSIPQRVVRGFFDNKAFLHSTNAQIIETISGWVVSYEFPSNYMDKALSTTQLKAIGETMAAKGLAFDSKVHKTLSKVKMAVIAGKSAAEAEVVFSGKIAFGKDYIVVGSKRFPCFADGRVKVGSQKLSVAVLRALLEAGNIPSSFL
jgi:hypothetical protein